MLEFTYTLYFNTVAKTMFLNNAHRTLPSLLYSGHAHKVDNLIIIWRLKFCNIRAVLHNSLKFS